MNKNLRTIALSATLAWAILSNVCAQDLKQLDSRIQVAIGLKKYDEANSLLDLALTKVNPKVPQQVRLYGTYLATKGDVAVRQKKYQAAIGYAGKAEKIFDKYPPDLFSINNVITLGYALLKTGDEDNEGASFLKFEKADKLQAKLKSPAVAVKLGDRYMTIGNEMLKPAKPTTFALGCAATLYGKAASLFEKGQDPVRRKVAWTKSLAVMERIQREEEAEDNDGDDKDDDDDDEEEEEDQDETTKSPLVIKNPYFALAAEMPDVQSVPQKNRTEADWEKYFKDCVAQNGKNSIATVVAHRMIGNFYRTTKGNYSKAEGHLVDAIAILKQLNALNTTTGAGCRKELAFIYMQSGKYDKVPEQIKESQLLAKELHRLAFNIGSSEEDKEAYVSIDWGMQMVMSFTDHIQKQKQKPDSLMSQLSYNAALYLNGLLLDDARKARARIKQLGDKEITALHESWMAQRQVIANVSIALRDSAIIKGTEVEEELSEALAKKRAVKANNVDVTWNQIKDKLAPDQAAVNFVQFKTFSGIALSGYSDRPEDVVYAAMVIRPGDSSPQFVRLGSELQIRQLLDRKDLYARSEERGFARIAYGDSLYQLVWKPIDKLLTGVTRVYFSAEGLLNRVAFAALPLPGTTTKTSVVNQCLNGRYELYQLFSTKELVQGIRPFRLESGTSIVLFGGVDYENGQVNPKTKGTTASLTYLQTAIQKERLPRFDILGASMLEVKEIHRILPRSELITGANASEKRFRQFSGHAPGIFHVATHGLYIRPEAKQYEITQDGAYMRTAMALSGANSLWQSKGQPLNVDDGLLTAYEVANQDLSQTRLVVLSACETALGDLRATEGVFGLPRAFRMAGAEKLLLSLWKVDDTVTKQLMTLFYGNLAAGQEVREAFRGAQMAIQKKYPQPTLWAAFVLIE